MNYEKLHDFCRRHGIEPPSEMQSPSALAHSLIAIAMLAAEKVEALEAARRRAS